MAEDAFAALRVGAEPAPEAPAPEGERDVFAALRIPGTNTGPPIRSPRAPNTLGEEFQAGLGSGIDSMQGSLYGVAGLAGRELGIDWLEAAGNEGAAKNFREAGESGRQSGGFTDIESAGGFFKWASASLGEAIPSLALAMSGGGIGGIVGKKAVELGVKKSLARSVERRLSKLGLNKEDTLRAARDYMESSTGQTALTRALTGKRTGKIIAAAEKKATTAGALVGAGGVSAAPQTGAIDQELLREGIAEPGLTALLGGVAGGALEALPAVRLLDKMFPGVDKQVSKAFVKDFAVATGTQAALEGSTEAAQEMIQLAALAYHDPTFDMFSPDAKRRVVDAFAAGALVGAVTGGGAEGIGAVKRGAFAVPKVAAPKLKAWSMTAADKVETALPAGFVAADNTLFEEVKGRVYSAIQPHVEAAVNGLQAQVQKVTDSLDENLEGGVNVESATIAQVAKAAHEKFLEDHGETIQQAKDYMNRQIEFITKTAKDMKDPEAREKFITDHVAATKEKLNGWLDAFRRAAAERDKSAAAEVDNMDMDDDMLEQLGVQIEQEETERRVGPSGRKFDRTVGPAVQEESSVVPKTETIQSGETEAAPTMTFGRNQLTAKVGVSGRETVVGYKNKKDAEKGRTQLKKKFPDAKNDAFRIEKQEDGSYVIQALDPTMRDDFRFWRDFDYSRKKANKNNPRRVTLNGADGTRFGYKYKSLTLDVENMSLRGRNIDQHAETKMDGFNAFAGELLQRGIINNEQFVKLQEAANKILPSKDPKALEGEAKIAAELKKKPFTTVTKFPRSNNPNKPDAVATANMMGFINKLKARGIKLPFKMLQTIENEDGTYSWGIPKSQQPVFRAFRAKNPAEAKAVLDGIKRERRQETLAAEDDKSRAFPRDDVLEGGRARSDPGGHRAGPRSTEARRTIDTKSGKFVTDRPSGVEGVERLDIDPQAGDKKTDPAQLTPEFADRADPSVRQRNRRANQNARELSKHDQKLLKRWARPGSVKIMLGKDVPASVQAAVTKLANFVTKTLGLSNQITVLDDTGLQLLIDQGAVTDPVFEQTLNDPSVHARNIRIHDNSFVYLSPKILSDPVATVLAFGHEMGHHVYRVAWDKLTPEGQQRLRKAFEATRTPQETSAEDKKLLKVTDETLQKWKAFVVKEKKRIAKLPVEDQQLESQNESLNQTQAGISNVEGARAREAARGQEATDAEFNEWMADQLAAWIARPRAPQGPVQAFFAKVGAQVRRLYDFIAKNDRFALNETFKEFADAVAQKARNTQDAKMDPFNDAQLKAWFRNEGVTMYQWFGQTLEQDNMDFTPVTAKGKQALARIEKNYPAVVKRAMVLRNWIVSAYQMAVAPATSAVRDIGIRVKTANKIADMFHRGKMGEAKGKQNYHQAVELMRGQFMDKYVVLQESIEAEIRKNFPGKKNAWVQNRVDLMLETMGKSLQKKDGDPNATFTPEEQVIRNLFDAMHKYATEAGLPVRKVTNYWPRALSRGLLVENKQKILDFLTDAKGMKLENARSLYNSLIDPNAQDGRATQDATSTPGFDAMNSREVQDPFFDQFLDNNVKGVVANYVNAVVKRAEFNRRLGEAMPVTNLDATEAIAKGIWDPKAKLNKLLADAKKEGATDEDLMFLKRYVDANIGQFGRDTVPPGLRKFMAGIIAYQNLRVLLFTVFASLPDSMGPAIRSGSMKTAWGALKSNMHEIARTDSDLAAMARAFGIVQDSISDHIMTEYVDNHYMPPKMQKWNQSFFKWTGLNYYTDLTRKYALAVGIDYIQQSHDAAVGDGTTQEKARGKDMLAELGLTIEDAAEWIASGKPTYDSQVHDMKGPERRAAEALVQFVDEAIMRPNAAQRPLLASHPGAMLAYHLKNYMYSITDIILKRIKFNIDESQSPAQYTAAILPALGMMLATAVGLELREMIQYAGSNRKPPTDRMDGWEYTWELAQRSGLTGYGQIGIDLEGAEDRGMSHVAGILGPAVSQAGDIISRPSTQTIPKAIPIVSQIPALRSLVREVL